MSGSKNLYIPDWTSWYYTIKVIARNNALWTSSTSAGATSDTAAYRFEGALENRQNNGSGAVLLGNVKTVITEDNASWDCNVSILYDGNNPYLDIECSYDHTTEDVYWVANVEVVQVQVPIEGPSSILACGFGEFIGGQFTTSNASHNDREYYSYTDPVSSITYYIFYTGSEFAIATSLGGTTLYSASNYVFDDWTVVNGTSPGGDTYDFEQTSACLPDILSCGFGSFADGLFTHDGFYNSQPYYIHSSSNWYMFWDGTYWVISVALGSNSYYYNSSTIANNWTETSGASPGGDTYDVTITSTCPPVSSSSSSSSGSSSSSSSN
jgi:hypothetical protein